MSETLIWIDPDGVQTYLDVDWAVKGRFFPAVDFEEDGVPGQPGLRLRAVRHGVHEFTLPHWVDGTTETDLRSKLRLLVARMDPTRGDGWVRCVAPGGDVREIECRVAAGLDVDETLGQQAGILSQRLTLTFRAWDPYWAATADTTITYAGGGVVATFFPFFPMRLSASETIAADTVTNPGDVDSWPVWTVTGPATDMTATNNTTGKTLTLTFAPALTNPQTVTIDTRPGAKTVTRDDGTSLFSALSLTSQLWPLARGSNSITVSVGGTTAASKVKLMFRPRYLGP